MANVLNFLLPGAFAGLSSFGATEVIVDFHHHYTPPELMERGAGDGSLRLDENGNPIYRFNPLLADLPAHVRMMDKAGIEVAVLSCGSGFDQPSLAICRLINDRMHQVETGSSRPLHRTRARPGAQSSGGIGRASSLRCRVRVPRCRYSV